MAESSEYSASLKSGATKSIPWMFVGEEEPVYVVRRRPHSDFDAYEVWVKHDAFTVTNTELTKLLGQFLQSLVRGSDLSAADPEATSESSEAPSPTPTRKEQQ